MLMIASTHAITTTHRCAIDQRSITVYVRSIGLYQRDSFDECCAPISRAECGPAEATSSEGGASVISPSAVSYDVLSAPGSPATVFDSSASPAGASPSLGMLAVPGPSAAAVRLMRRAASIGVSVNETSRETAIANEEVKPNEDMKRPTMPPMKPTGRKTASRESVVAITASPISRVPSIAA